MQSGDLNNKIGGAVLVLSLLFGIGFTSATAVNAQEPRDRDGQDRHDGNHDRGRRGRTPDGYPDLGGSFQLRQTALNAGYNGGIKVGRKNRNRSGRDFRNESAYQSATKDYNSGLGDRETYRRYFRMAFETGYQDGLNGN
jgi:hypothetical protein